MKVDESMSTMGKHSTARQKRPKHYYSLHRRDSTAMFWFYVASELTSDYTGWKRPFSWGSDLQNNKSYTTAMVRLPFNRYVIIRLWRLKNINIDIDIDADT